jgi:uncharacterized protein involved in exopolysaccharide biosynthesis
MPAAMVFLVAAAAGFLLGGLLAALRSYLQTRRRTTIAFEGAAA